MVLWRKGFKSFVSYRIPLSIKHTVVSLNRTGMTINLPSDSSPLASSRRAIHTTPKHDPSLQDKYEELNDLLSDSDGWDEDLEPVQASHKKQVKNAQVQSSRIANEFSDADDSIISEFLKSAKNSNAGLEKQLAGASTKSSRKPPARSSFSSLVSEEYRRPLVESTQQGGLFSSEDSRLLLSLLRGDNSDRPEENCIQQSSQSSSKPSCSGIVEQLESTNTNDEGTKNIVPTRTPRVNVPKINIPKIDVPNIDISQCIKTEDPSGVESTRESRVILGPPKTSNILERSAPRIPSIPEQSAPNNFGSKRCLQDDHSLMITEEQEKVQFAEKFTLLTQRNCIQNTQEIENRLKLHPKGKVMIPVRLSKEQEDVIRLAEAGHNIFYTGSAGTGKSVLLREMIKVLKDVYGHDQVAVTASTGLAACNIGGVTLHSFAGVGLGHGEVTKVYRKVRRSRKHVKRWENVSALVIDEISMLDGELLDKLDFIAQKIRKNHKPFGDIQLIFCGDFFQLPPVTKDPNNSTKFAFESKVWKEGIDVTIMLTKVFRQQGDSKFIEMLNKMRLGQIDAETEREFKKLSRPLPQDEIIPAELYSTRNEVERANYQRLNRLPGKAHVFHAIDGGVLEDREMKEKLLQNFLAPKELQLKIGAQVMMIKNIDATLVNGSLGKVIDFIDPETYMFYETILRNPDLSPGALAKLKDNPELLRETWNEFCEESENDTPVRQKTIKDNFCRGDPDESVAQLGESIFDFLKDASSDDIETRTNLDRKRELLKEVHESSKGRKKLPLVRFKTSDMSTRTILVEPESWAIEDENEKALVSRVQLPLMLAWSLSIHKSQGQTLPKVKVDLRRVFEKGQAYVALSRAVSRDGLQVLNFDKTRINAHQKVIDFYGTLITVEHAIKRLQTEAGPMGSSKKRKVSTGPAMVSNAGRARQTRSKSKTPTNTVSSPSGIATMLMQRVSRENRQADR